MHFPKSLLVLALLLPGLFSPSSSSLPSSTEATGPDILLPPAALTFSPETMLSPHPPILIEGNEGFTVENGVTQGTGSASDPYIIEWWKIDSSSGNGIELRNMNAYFVIRNVWVHSVSFDHTAILLNATSNGLVTETIIGNGFTGIGISDSSNLTITSNTLTGSRESGIGIAFSREINVSDNNISSSNLFGIRVYASEVVFVTDNRISDNGYGIILSYSIGITLMGNVFTSNGVRLDGFSLSQFNSHIISLNNSVNGRPLYYYKDCSDLELNNVSVGQLIVVNCRNVKIGNLLIEDTDLGITLYFVQNSLVYASTIERNEIGIFVPHSTNVTMQNNTVSHNSQGVNFYYSTNSVLSANQISDNGYGVSDVGSNITITNNILLRNTRAVAFTQSSNLTISGNLVARNFNGLEFHFSERILITRNTISQNTGTGVYLRNSSDVILYHNNIVENSVQAQDSSANSNSWDDGYPNGGNFWSDYDGLDICSGSSQDQCPDPDGIGDMAYTINVIDHYPLIEPWPITTQPGDLVPPTWSASSRVTAFNVTTTSLVLEWSPASDDRFVARYRVYLGMTLIAEIANPFCKVEAPCLSRMVTGLEPGETYTFMVEAGDEGNNWTSGPMITVTTLGTPAPQTRAPGLWEQISIPLLVGIGVVMISGAVLWRSLRNPRKETLPTRESQT